MIPVFIPQKPGERQAMTDALRFQFTMQGGDVTVDDGPELWTEKVDRWLRAQHGERHPVVVSNNDVVLAADSLRRLVAPLAEHDIGATVADPGGGGWLFACWSDLRLDTNLKHWYSETDAWRRLTEDGCKVVFVDTGAEHLHPNESTFGDPVMLAQARADEDTYARKWGDDPSTLFFGRTA